MRSFEMIRIRDHSDQARGIKGTNEYTQGKDSSVP